MRWILLLSLLIGGCKVQSNLTVEQKFGNYHDGNVRVTVTLTN